MDISKKYCAYVGTARGVIEYTHCKEDEKLQYTLPEKQSEITTLEWGRNENEIIVGHKDGEVYMFDTVNNKFTEKFIDLPGTGGIIGAASLGESILVAKPDGTVSTVSEGNTNSFTVKVNKQGSLHCMVFNKARGDIFGTGGEYNVLKLWNVETHQCVFQAKPLGRDELGIFIPAAVRGIAFLPDLQLSVCATKEGHVLLYDQRVQRKPVVKFEEPKASYTCVASAFRDWQCLAGSTKGYMPLIDMRSPKRSVKCFMSFTGSVTSIYCDPVAPVVFSTSLDRFFRVHDLDNKKPIYKLYMKQNLTRVLVKPVIKEERDEESIEDVKETTMKDNVDEEYEELFNNMETIDSESKKVKRKMENATGKKKKMKKIE